MPLQDGQKLILNLPFIFIILPTGPHGTVLQESMEVLNILLRDRHFFVNVTEGNSIGTLKMDNGVKVHNNIPYLKQPKAILDNLIRLEVSGNGFADETLILMNESSTADFDADFDAHKLFSFNTDAPQIYSTANNFMAVNSLPMATSEIPIDVRGANDMEMTISMTEHNGYEQVFLRDNLSGINTNLTDDNYNFKYDNSILDRFAIYFIIAGLEEQSIKDVFNIYAYGKEINVIIPDEQNAEIFVYNLNGQTISHSSGSTGANKIPMVKMGYYLVKVVSDNSITTQKVFIK